MKILENNNKSNSLEENLILVETIPIKEYTYNRLVVSFGGKLWIIQQRLKCQKYGEFHLEEFLFYVAREECLEQRKRERLG